ncbi:MAG: NosR/NirI family nitrous oxide reductase transcriptional regulator [Planctomycetota bacterium]|jgi:NosR/NirI family nitrous oxide reductase transcriptional regulator
MTENRSPRRRKQLALHLVRVLLFASVLCLIHREQETLNAARALAPTTQVNIEELLELFPRAASLSETPGARGRREVLDGDGDVLGFIVRTSPLADDVIGFCGPTDTLIAFNSRERILGTLILTSQDTRDHVAAVRGDRSFLSHLSGLSWEEASLNEEVDGVTGATLTSVAIQEGILLRLSGTRASLRFTTPIKVTDAQTLFAAASSLEAISKSSSRWRVLDATGAELGTLLRISPAADAVVGYQGPSDAIVGFDTAGGLTGLTLLETYDNEEYAVYLRDDEYYRAQFKGLTLAELAGLDPIAEGIDGVSGSTLISDSITEGMILAAQAERASSKKLTLEWLPRDWGTALVILLGAVIGMTSLRSNEKLRTVFLCVLVGYLGFVNGDMLSQALLVGWAQHGVPWRTASGLVLLTFAAFLIPLATKRNLYCSHLCPHGALQQLVKRRIPWQPKVPKRVVRLLRRLPLALLAVSVIVPMTGAAFSLVDIEPFDAWVYSIAGWPTLVIAAVGLAVSLFIPMAYCKYGCPTGALLEFLRFNAKSGEWSNRDWAALALLGVAACLMS